MERDFDNTASQEKEEDDFNPVKELRCALVKTSLKSFVVEHAARYYQAAAFRVMLPSPPEVEVWLARQRMEERLAQESMVVGFFSCATALQNVSKDKKTNQNIAGISFWVMFDAPEMVIESFENHLTRIARDIGLETVHSKAVKGRGIKSITGGYVSSLYITLKDHNNEALLHHFAKSQMKCVRKAAQEEDITLENVEMTEGERYSSKKLTSLWLLESMATDVASELKKSVKCLDGLMNIKLVDLTSSENPVIAAPRPVSKLMQGITAIKSYMERFGYGLFDGHIYKRAPAAKFTYVYCSSVLDFVHFTLGSPDVADQIGSQVNPIINLLSVSSCRVIKPIKIDYNFIEVTPFGTCFNIREKCFQVDPVDLEGSPRAFVKYTYDEKRTPNPKPFVQGVENSFGNPVILRKFYKKYYQLLMHGQFPHKESKLCLVGPADSGKTSWFAPFQGVIPVRYIAGVMNDGRFSAALISNNTQICMMDEWTPDSLSCVRMQNVCCKAE
uniref:Uncharacterized protein n=1 Tax=Clytia hemisphaerica TaxID=252671 RepID=A0A7M5WRZ6_9CNID